jgi:hypothetical protein
MLDGLNKSDLDQVLSIDDDDAIEKITTKIIRELDHGEK